MQAWAQEAYGKPVASCTSRVLFSVDEYICVNCEWYWQIGDVRHYQILEEYDRLRVDRPFVIKRKGPLLDKDGNPRTGRPSETQRTIYDDFDMEALEEWNPISV